MSSALIWAGTFPGEPEEVFDPATLSLSGWWRGSYSGSPWVGTASEGSSGSRNLSESTNPPSVGTAVNGFAPAVFDGVNDELSAGIAISNFISSSAYFVWALAWINAISSTGGLTSAFTNQAVLADMNGFWGFSLSRGSGNNRVQFWHWDGAAKGVEISVTTQQWVLLMARYDGANIRARINSGSVSSASAGSITNVSNTLRMGRGGAIYNGRVLDAGLMASAGSDDLFDDIRDYVNARYGLAL